MAAKVILIAGLGFGDEGKGTITDFLAASERAGLVVRYNGGPQAAHNVVTDDGRHHCFAQFGSGTLAGAKTHLSKYMLVDLGSMANEARVLARLIDRDPFELTTIHESSLLITSLHKHMNRLQALCGPEEFRHGTCGMGIGEAREYDQMFPDFSPRVGDIRDIDLLKSKLEMYQKYCLSKADRLKVPSIGVARGYYETLRAHIAFFLLPYTQFGDRIQIVDDVYLRAALQTEETVIFEGAQGALLDENFGFPPYNTWTNTTFFNAIKLLEEAKWEGSPRRIGVTRTFMTRHGAGPFPTEHFDLRLYPDTEHNTEGEWQGRFRNGNLDAALLKYGLLVLEGVDELAVTHVDCLASDNLVCTEYLHCVPENATAEDLSRAEVVYLDVPKNKFIPWLASYLGSRVSIISSGQRRQDKRYL